MTFIYLIPAQFSVHPFLNGEKFIRNRMLSSLGREFTLANSEATADATRLEYTVDSILQMTSLTHSKNRSWDI